MDVSLAIRKRLRELGLDQRDLAAAAQVTESYISQLLTQRKPPPGTDRTDIYPKMEEFLGLPAGQLSKLADLQRIDELRKQLGDRPPPLVAEVRELVLRKCVADRQSQVRAIFEKEPFGEVERLVTQKLLDLAKGVVRSDAGDRVWLRNVARMMGRRSVQLRADAVEFLEADVLNLPEGRRLAWLDFLIESWDIDLVTFGLAVVLNERVTSARVRSVEFAEKNTEQPAGQEPGLKRFLADRIMSGDVTGPEVEFLKRLRFDGRRPTPLYYYRELQNLRDPLHFVTR